jgi:hypothetical protein
MRPGRPGAAHALARRPVRGWHAHGRSPQNGTGRCSTASIRAVHDPAVEDVGPPSARDPARARALPSRLVGTVRRAGVGLRVPREYRQARRATEASENSYAKRLRDALFRAGIVRMPPIEVPATKPGQRTDLDKRVEGTKPAPNPRDPLYFETATTLPVDFHSFRRGFNTALAGAGVNLQQAMHLAGYSDAKTHMRYVMQSPATRAIPPAALPKLTVSAARIVTGCDDSRREIKSSMISARPAGLGPATRGLEAHSARVGEVPKVRFCRYLLTDPVPRQDLSIPPFAPHLHLDGCRTP